MSRLHRHVGFVPIVLQNSFWITEDKFSGLWRGDRMIVRGTTATSDELTGNFALRTHRSAIIACSFRGKIAESHFGVLQHYLPTADMC
jgi:uncharacterized NAD(P)/FAD-binding protein YdhS